LAGEPRQSPLPSRERVIITTSPLPSRERVRERGHSTAWAALSNNIPAPLAGEGQGTGSTAVSLFPLPSRERVRERGMDSTVPISL